MEKYEARLIFNLHNRGSENGVNLEKRVALYTMHELLMALEGSPIRKQIVLEPDLNIEKSAKDLVIKIKQNLADENIKIIQPIVEKRNLKIQKLEDAFVIH